MGVTTERSEKRGVTSTFCKKTSQRVGKRGVEVRELLHLPTSSRSMAPAGRRPEHASEVVSPAGSAGERKKAGKKRRTRIKKKNGQKNQPASGKIKLEMDRWAEEKKREGEISRRIYRVWRKTEGGESGKRKAPPKKRREDTTWG